MSVSIINVSSLLLDRRATSRSGSVFDLPPMILLGAKRFVLRPHFLRLPEQTLERVGRRVGRGTTTKEIRVESERRPFGEDRQGL